MRTHAFVQVVAAGIIASTYGLEINKTDPAALEMCPAVDGFAEVDSQGIFGGNTGSSSNFDLKTRKRGMWLNEDPTTPTPVT